ncbi:MAG: hypothetical protein KF773_03815 [Deltaproteobacteria bacterium]|nr:hypothetical protein [Deltaproteobacteria bacterium]MCW5807361.1 hypothetical protein [Deltaproteobacteria bacterium]
MSTAQPLATAYESLRLKILQRLLDLRSSLDPSLGRLDDVTARAQISAVLDHIGNFIASGDLGLHRAFLHTFLAMRAAEAQSPAAVLAMLVAIGDTAAQVAQDESPGNPENGELTLLLTRVTASTARAVNDLIADELMRRMGTWGELRARASQPAVIAGAPVAGSAGKPGKPS